MKEKAGFVRKAAKWAAVGCVLAGVSLSGAAAPEQAEAEQGDKPNIVVIWGDDIGRTNISAYTHGLMGYQTPNIDRMASEA